MKQTTLFILAKALLLHWAVFIVIGILTDPLGNHSVWQPLCAVVLMLALDKYEETHGERK